MTGAFICVALVIVCGESSHSSGASHSCQPKPVTLPVPFRQARLHKALPFLDGQQEKVARLRPAPLRPLWRAIKHGNANKAGEMIQRRADVIFADRERRAKATRTPFVYKQAFPKLSPLKMAVEDTIHAVVSSGGKYQARLLWTWKQKGIHSTRDSLRRHAASILVAYVHEERDLWRLYSNGWVDRWPYAEIDPRPLLVVGYSFSKRQCSFGSDGGAPGIDGGGYSGDHCDQTKDQANEGDAALSVGEPSHGFGGVRRTSLLDEIICLQAIIFGGFGAAIAFVRGFPPHKPFKPLWIAAGAAGTVACVSFLRPLVTGWIWLPWV